MTVRVTSILIALMLLVTGMYRGGGLRYVPARAANGQEQKSPVSPEEEEEAGHTASRVKAEEVSSDRLHRPSLQGPAASEIDLPVVRALIAPPVSPTRSVPPAPTRRQC